MKRLVFWLLAFTVFVKTPLGVEKKFTAERVEVGTYHYKLILPGGKEVYVPIMFTIIEEK